MGGGGGASSTGSHIMWPRRVPMTAPPTAPAPAAAPVSSWVRPFSYALTSPPAVPAPTAAPTRPPPAAHQPQRRSRNPHPAMVEITSKPTSSVLNSLMSPPLNPVNVSLAPRNHLGREGQ